MSIVYHIISITDALRSDDTYVMDNLVSNIEHFKKIPFTELHSGCTDAIVLCIDQSPNVYDQVATDRLNKIKDVIAANGVRAKFILDSTFLDESLIQSSDDIIFVSLWRMLALQYCNRQPRNKQVNFDKNLGLFLPGRIHRYNRLVLFKKLYELNLLNHIIWSCQYSYDELDQLKSFKEKWFSGYDEVKWKKFTSVLPKNLDIINFDKIGHFGCGFPYDVSLYQNTIFSIIAESDILHYTVSEDGPTTISEKTWKAIMNFHPFIISGNKGTLAKLEKWGYKTFREYTTFPNYNDMNPRKRIEQTAKNIEFFARNLQQNQKRVQEDCTHNYKLLKKHYLDDLSILNEFLKDDWHQNTIDRIIENIAIGNMFMEINTIS
jgi:hypothetical protein